MVYYLRVLNPNGLPVYKIGITNRTIAKRYLDRDFEKVKVLKMWRRRHGTKAYAMEQRILEAYKADKYKGAALLNSGNGELFVRDILGP
jgi:hypothetical protein